MPAINTCVQFYTHEDEDSPRANSVVSENIDLQPNETLANLFAKFRAEMRQQWDSLYKGDPTASSGQPEMNRLEGSERMECESSCPSGKVVNLQPGKRQCPTSSELNRGGISTTQASAKRLRPLPSATVPEPTLFQERLPPAQDDAVSLCNSEADRDLEVLMSRTTEGLDEVDQEQLRTDEVILSLGKYIEPKKVAPKINDHLAKTIKNVWHRERTDPEKVRMKLDDIETPGNCTFLEPPKTNGEIFSKLQEHTLATDVSLQKTQLMLGKTAACLSKVLDGLLETTPENITAEQLKGVIGNTTTALSLLADCNSFTVQRRKDRITRSLAKDLKGLRKIHQPESGLLFGNDLPTTIKNLRQDNVRLFDANQLAQPGGEQPKKGGWSAHKQYNNNNNKSSSNNNNSRSNSRGGRGGRGRRRGNWNKKPPPPPKH